MRTTNQEQTPRQNAERKPIEETTRSVSYLGVRLEKAEHSASKFVPKREQYEDFFNDTDVALPLQRDIAVAFLNGDPLLVEGGTALGKTTTVRKMAAELGWEVHYANLNGATDVEDLMGRYIPNAHKATPDSPDYTFSDGKITSGLRQEEGKTKVIILDEFNACAPNILIRLHEVLDALERNGDVILSEDASEVIPTNKGKTKVIALMNPPGKGYFGREPLDPAQLRRWIYKKMPSELPTNTFSQATNALFGMEASSQAIDPALFLPPGDSVLTVEQLQEIPGIQEMLEKYKEFHKAAKELVKARRVAEDQPQPFTFDDRMEPRRVRDFVLRFYQGDINETFQQALHYFYSNKLESDVDREKFNELIRLVEYTPSTSSSRKPLETQTSTEPAESGRESSVAEKEMKKLFGKYYFGTEALEKTCTLMDKRTGILRLTPAQKKEMDNQLATKLAEPDVREFLKRLERDPVEKEKWMLINVPRIPSSVPFSILSLTESLDVDARRQSISLIYQGNDTNRLDFFRQNVFATEQVQPGAYFVSKNVLEGTTSKTQDQQTALLQAEATRLGFAPGKWKRTHPALRFLSLLENFKVNNERLMPNVYDRSDIATAAGYLAVVGYFDADGVGVSDDVAGANSDYGSSLVR